MRKLLSLSFALVIAFTLAACDDDVSAPSTVTAEPSDQLQTIVDQGPTDFTWAMFNDEIIASGTNIVDGIYEPEESVDLQFCAVPVQADDIGSEHCSEPVPTAASDWRRA